MLCYSSKEVLFIVVALEASARIALTVSSWAASAAIIYGVLGVTGLMLKVTSVILAFSGGSSLLAIIMICAMSYILGMGLPVTAAYVFIAALGAPALIELGVTMLAAHMIIFWFSQDSTITPPICMTAFVAARIANAPPMKTGWQSVMMAKGLYLIPFIFAYGDLLGESLLEMFFDFTDGALEQNPVVRDMNVVMLNKRQNVGENSKIVVKLTGCG